MRQPLARAVQGGAQGGGGRRAASSSRCERKAPESMPPTVALPLRREDLAGRLAEVLAHVAERAQPGRGPRSAGAAGSGKGAERRRRAAGHDLRLHRGDLRAWAMLACQEGQGAACREETGVSELHARSTEGRGLVARLNPEDRARPGLSRGVAEPRRGEAARALLNSTRLGCWARGFF